MTDLIDRAKAIKAIEEMQDCYNGFSGTYDKAQIIGVLEEVPPVDAVEVVRCKDCKHYKFSVSRAFACYVNRCEITGFEDVDDDDFCSRAERREDG